MAAFPTVEDDVHDSSISFGPDRDARKVDGFRAFREAGEFYQSVCRPEFEKLCVPGFLIRELSGSDKFFNRCARRGLVRLVEVDGGHGAFLLKPNCAYHDLLECALRKQRKCEEGADAEIAETLLGLADDPTHSVSLCASTRDSRLSPGGWRQSCVRRREPSWQSWRASDRVISPI